MQSGMGNQQQQKPKRRRGRGCLVGSLVTLLIVVLLVVGGWFLVLKPTLRNTAIDQINQKLSNGVNNIPPAVAALPDGSQTVSDTILNNLISSQSSSSSPVQNISIRFTTNDAEVSFQVFGFSSTITTVPQIVNNKLVATNVTVNGLASLILSADDVTNIINTQINNVQTHIHHTFTGVKLEDHAITLTLSGGVTIPGSGFPTLP
jgi:hypothetical protein